MGNLEGAAKSATSFAQDQIPLAVNEWIQWEVASCIFWIVVGCIPLILFIIWVYYCVKELKKSSSTGDDFLVFLTISMLLCAIWVPLIGVHTHDLVKIKVAPRVVILEKISEMVKK